MSSKSPTQVAAVLASLLTERVIRFERAGGPELRGAAQSTVTSTYPALSWRLSNVSCSFASAPQARVRVSQCPGPGPGGPSRPTTDGRAAASARVTAKIISANDIQVDRPGALDIRVAVG